MVDKKKTEVQFNLRTLSGSQTWLHIRVTWGGALAPKRGKVSIHTGAAWNGEWEPEQREEGVWAREWVVVKKEDWSLARGLIA